MHSGKRSFDASHQHEAFTSFWGSPDPAVLPPSPARASSAPLYCVLHILMELSKVPLHIPALLLSQHGSGGRGAGGGAPAQRADTSVVTH